MKLIHNPPVMDCSDIKERVKQHDEVLPFYQN